MIEQQSAQTRATEHYFSGAASRWSANYAPGGSMSPRIVAFLEPLRARLKPPAQVLDFGCGTGELASAMFDAGYQVSGCDVSPAMLSSAAQHARGRRIAFRAVDDAPRLPWPAATFDAVVASSVLEYCDQPVAQLLELGRALKPGGVLAFTVPDVRNPVRHREARKKFLLGLPGVARVLGLMPQRVRYRLKLDYLRISVNRPPLEVWQRWLRATGFDPAALPESTGPLVRLEATKL